MLTIPLHRTVKALAMTLGKCTTHNRIEHWYVVGTPVITLHNTEHDSTLSLPDSCPHHKVWRENIVCTSRGSKLLVGALKHDNTFEPAGLVPDIWASCLTFGALNTGLVPDIWCHLVHPIQASCLTFGALKRDDTFEPAGLVPTPQNTIHWSSLGQPDW